MAVTTRITRTLPSATAPAQAEEPEETRSIAGAALDAGKSIGSGALSGLSMIGNMLDLPGSMVRDALVWDNPFDQILSPFSHSDNGGSASGRDVLSRNVLTSWLFTPNKETGVRGWLSDPLEGIQDVAGFATEMALDPLAWISGGLSKVPAGGSKAAKGLGLFSDVAHAVATPAKAGKLGKLEKVLDILNELDPGTHVGRALGIPQAIAKSKAAKAAAAVRPANQIDDPILQMAGTPVPIAPSSTIRGKLDRIGDVISSLDPGPHVGKQVRKAVKWAMDEFNLPQLYQQQVTNRFLKNQYVQAWNARSQQRAARSRILAGQSISESPGSSGLSSLNAHQELQSLQGSGIAARGSRIIEDLNEAQTLATKIGNSFGAEVLFWGGAPTASKARGVRVSDLGSRIWINSDAAHEAYNGIVGHEMLHLIHDVNVDTFNSIVDIISHHAPSGHLSAQVAKYMSDYKAVMGLDLRQGMQLEEGVARTIQDAFDRPAFWDQLMQDPKLAPQVRDAFSQAMDKIKHNVTAQEFEVLDRELSSFMFGMSDELAAGATAESILKSMDTRGSRGGYTGLEVEPLADMLASPGTRTHAAIQTVATLAENIATGIRQAMVYKYGGKSYRVVQDFAAKKTQTYENIISDSVMPAIASADEVDRIVTNTKLAEGMTPASLTADIEDKIAWAIEKNDYSELAEHPQLHPMIAQMKSGLSASREAIIHAGGNLSELTDTFVDYLRHDLHPIIKKKAQDTTGAHSGYPPSDLASANKSVDSSRTNLFKEAFGGRRTWNRATVDTDVLKIMKDFKAIPSVEDRITAAAEVLRAKYGDDIDPRIPVMRGPSENLYVMLQRMPDGSLKELTMTHAEFDALERVAPKNDILDFANKAGRLDEYANEPIVYKKVLREIKKDKDGNIIKGTDGKPEVKETVLEFEQLTGRLPGDTRYGNPLSENEADWGFYKSADEIKDRSHVLAEWMKKIGTETLEQTSGVFSNSLHRSYIEHMTRLANTRGVLEAIPQMIAGGIVDGVIKVKSGDALHTGTYPKLGSLWQQPGYANVNKTTVYLKAATMIPSLQTLASKLNGKQFTKVMDDMEIDPKVFDDILGPGTFMQSMKALDPITKPFQSMNAIWKSWILAHPSFHTRNFGSAIVQAEMEGMYSNTAFQMARDTLYSRPNPDLLEFAPIKEYLDRFKQEHTPENATRAARVMFGTLMSQEGGSIFRDTVDSTGVDTIANGISDVIDPLPGDGRSSVWDMLKGVGRTLIGREGDTTFSFFDIAGVMHATDKTDAAGKVTAKAGDVRMDHKFSGAVANDIAGKHVNDFTRMVPWIENMRQGDSAMDAFRKATKNQLDYNPRHYGPAEAKIMKKLFPFYSFISRETMWVAKELLTNPTGRLGKLIRVARLAQPQNEYLPEHVSHGMAIPFGKSPEDGTDNFLTGLGLMFEDPLSMAGDVLQGDSKATARNVLSKMTPALKSVAEWGLGRSSFQGGPMGGRDLDDMDPVAGRILTRLGVQKERPGGLAAPAFDSPGLEFLLSNSPVSRYASSLKTALDPRKSIPIRAMNILTGMKVTSVSPVQKQYALRELTNSIAKDLGSRAFTTYHVSQEMLNDAKENDPEKYAKLLWIVAERRRMDKERRIRKRAAEAEAESAK